MANITLGTPTINEARTVITVPIAGATGALTMGDTPNIAVDVDSEAVDVTSVAGSGTGGTAALVVTLTASAGFGLAVTVTAADSSIVDASGDTLTNATVTVTETIYVNMALIDNSRYILTLPVLNSIGALTVGDSPGITVTVGGNSATVSSITTKGTGATTALVVKLADIVPVGSAVVVNIAASGIVDSESDAMADAATIDVTDPLTANQTQLQAMVQAGIANYFRSHQLYNGMFGQVVPDGGGNFIVYQLDNVTPLALVVGEVDTAGNLLVHSWRNLP